MCEREREKDRERESVCVSVCVCVCVCKISESITKERAQSFEGSKFVCRQTNNTKPLSILSLPDPDLRPVRHGLLGARNAGTLGYVDYFDNTDKSRQVCAFSRPTVNTACELACCL